MFQLPESGVVQIQGADAEKIINNLCTQDVKQLAVGGCCEAFVTNVRGWCVEHTYVLKCPNKIWLVGQFANPAGLCSHINRYIIREDAHVTDLSHERRVLLLSESEAAKSAEHFKLAALAPIDGCSATAELSSYSLLTMGVHLLAARDVLWICDVSDRSGLLDLLTAAGIQMCSDAEFEQRRIASFWPRAGREILEKSLPQELDRDSSAISFTKGCYLGQETIARLDAIGQLQKKLCLVRIETNQSIEVGTPLLRDEQQVGQITSTVAAAASSHQLALAYLRRGNFEIGTQLTCTGSSAIVVAPN